jgi:hypothetical protein
MTTITWYGDYIAPDFTDENLWNRYLKQYIPEEGSKNFTIDPLLDYIIFNYFKSQNEFKTFNEYKATERGVVIIGLHGGWNQQKLALIDSWFASNPNRLLALHDANCRIIIDYSEEGFTEEVFPDLTNWIAQYNLADRVLYVSSTCNVESVYLQWCRRNKMPVLMKCAWYGFFANWINFNQRYRDKPELGIPMAKWKPGTRRFMSLNRRPYPHRIFFVTLLEHFGLVEHGAVSMPKHFTEPDINWEGKDFDLPYQWQLLKDRCNGYIDNLDNSFNQVYNKLPLIADTDRFDINYALDLNNTLYDEYPVNLVTETLFFTNAIFPTEKIFKPMLHGQIFLLAGAPGFLQQLREYGFKTFGPYIDESYDAITDPVERGIELTRTLKRIIALSEADFAALLLQCQPTIQHNRHLLTNKAFMDQLISTQVVEAIETLWD